MTSSERMVQLGGPAAPLVLAGMHLATGFSWAYLAMAGLSSVLVCRALIRWRNAGRRSPVRSPVGGSG